MPASAALPRSAAPPCAGPVSPVPRSPRPLPPCGSPVSSVPRSPRPSAALDVGTAALRKPVVVSAQVGPLEVGRWPLGPLEVGTPSLGPLKVGRRSLRSPEVHVSQRPHCALRHAGGAGRQCRPSHCDTCPSAASERSDRLGSAPGRGVQNFPRDSNRAALPPSPPPSPLSYGC